MSNPGRCHAVVNVPSTPPARSESVAPSSVARAPCATSTACSTSAGPSSTSIMASTCTPRFTSAPPPLMLGSSSHMSRCSATPASTRDERMGVERTRRSEASGAHVGRDRSKVREQAREVAGSEIAIGMSGDDAGQRVPVGIRRGDRLLDEHVDPRLEQLAGERHVARRRRTDDRGVRPHRRDRFVEIREHG